MAKKKPTVRKTPSKTQASLRINADNPDAILIELVAPGGAVLATSTKSYASMKTATNAVPNFLDCCKGIAKAETYTVKQLRTRK